MEPFSSGCEMRLICTSKTMVDVILYPIDCIDLQVDAKIASGSCVPLRL